MPWQDGEWVDDEQQPYDDNAHNQIDQSVKDTGESSGKDPQTEHQFDSIPQLQTGHQTEEDMKKQLGDLYTPGAYDEYKHHDYDQGWYDRIVNKENLRKDNKPNSEYHENGQGGYLTQGQAGGGTSASGSFNWGGGGQGGGQSHQGDIWSQLQGLFPNGAFNQGVVDRRVSNARDDMARTRKQQTSQNQAALASRGLLGSGPEASAMGSLEDRLGQNFNSQVNDIYSNESQNADNRMMQALQLATGMSEGEANREIEKFRAQTEHDLGFGRLDLDRSLGMGNLDLNRMLGQGNLALGNLNAVNGYNLGLGQQGLDRDRLQHDIDSGNIDAIIKMFEQMYGGASNSAGGYY